MLDNPSLLALLERRRQEVPGSVSTQEWASRVELAACYRLLARFRMTDWIYNHVSSRVPGDCHGHYLINPFGLLYEEISASNLVKVDVGGNLVEDVGFDVNPAAFVIHGAIHHARPDVGCVLHTHTAAGVAVATQEHGLLPVTQHALKFHQGIAYHDFEGIALDHDEQQRLVADIGAKNVLILRNHGLLTMGRTVADAFERMYFLERACQIQISALAGGAVLCQPAPDVCARTLSQYEGATPFLRGRDWQALLRMLDREQPDYKL